VRRANRAAPRTEQCGAEGKCRRLCTNPKLPRDGVRRLFGTSRLTQVHSSSAVKAAQSSQRRPHEEGSVSRSGMAARMRLRDDLAAAAKLVLRNSSILQPASPKHCKGAPVTTVSTCIINVITEGAKLVDSASKSVLTLPKNRPSLRYNNCHPSPCAI
jgi:hypothetical protein